MASGETYDRLEDTMTTGQFNCDLCLCYQWYDVPKKKKKNWTPKKFGVILLKVELFGFMKK